MKNEAEAWEYLHDAVLVDLHFDWAKALVVAAFRASYGNVEISVDGVTLLECPRRLPWGRSVSLLKAQVTEAVEGEHAVELEMQSGDVIRIVGGAVVLRQRS